MLFLLGKIGFNFINYQQKKKICSLFVCGKREADLKSPQINNWKCNLKKVLKLSNRIILLIWNSYIISQMLASSHMNLGIIYQVYYTWYILNSYMITHTKASNWFDTITDSIRWYAICNSQATYLFYHFFFIIQIAYLKTNSYTWHSCVYQKRKLNLNNLLF